jgi:hypothetical protein
MITRRCCTQAGNSVPGPHRNVSMSSLRERRSTPRRLRAVFPHRLVIFLFAVAGSWRAPPWLPAQPQRTLRRSSGRENMPQKRSPWVPAMQLRGGASGGSKAQGVSTTGSVVSWAANATTSNATRQKGKGEMSSPRNKAGTVRGSLCRFVEGCTRDASFGDQGSDTRLFCARHKQPHHVDNKHKTCASAGCSKQGQLWPISAGTMRRLCVTHAVAELPDVPRPARLPLAARCCWTVAAAAAGGSGISENTTLAQRHTRRESKVCRGAAGDVAPLGVCFKMGLYHVPSSSASGRAKSLFCREHAPAKAVKARRFCRHRGCDRAAAYGEPGARRASFCPQHRNSSHVDFAHKRCQHADATCYRQASYGDRGDRVARFCARHRLAGHTDVRSRVCQALPGCHKLAKYLEPGTTSARFCASHALPGMQRTCVAAAAGTTADELQVWGWETLFESDTGVVRLQRHSLGSSVVEQAGNVAPESPAPSS